MRTEITNIIRGLANGDRNKALSYAKVLLANTQAKFVAHGTDYLDRKMDVRFAERILSIVEGNETGDRVVLDEAPRR